MAMKKGQFFTIDAIIAGGIIFITILITSSVYLNEQPRFQISFVSQDVIRTLSTLTVVEVDNVYINERISSSDIKNTDNTVMEQIVEFWYLDNREFANKTVSNVTTGLIPDNMGFGIWVNDEAIYTRDAPIIKSLVSSKKIIGTLNKENPSISGDPSRKNLPTSAGPFIAEVRAWQ